MYLNSTLETEITSKHIFYQTEPVTSLSTSVSYVLMKAPTYGYLFSALSKYRLKTGFVFTQEDVISKNIKYKLYRKAYSFIFDSITLTVLTPGCSNMTTNLTIVHTPAQVNTSGIHIVLKTISVDEGGKVNITPAYLDIYSDLTSSLFYNVTDGPHHGVLQVERNGSLENNTSYFTSVELKSNFVTYIHDDSESDHDSFNFMALSSEEENFQYVEKFHFNILLKNDNSPVRVINKVFHVVVGGQRLLTGDDLKYIDNDINSTPKDIIYNCRELPNGDIFNVNNPHHKLTEFSQEDLDNRLIIFKHRGPEFGKIKLWITDGQYYLNSILEVQASAPFIRIITNKKLNVQQGKLGLISNEHIFYDTNLYAVDVDVVYEVVRKPTYGRIVTKQNWQVSSILLVTLFMQHYYINWCVLIRESLIP